MHDHGLYEIVYHGEVVYQLAKFKYTLCFLIRSLNTHSQMACLFEQVTEWYADLCPQLLLDSQN